MSVLVETVKQQIKGKIYDAAQTAINKGEFDSAELCDFTIEMPANRTHGDYAVNAAMVWARAFHKAPRQIAEILMQHANFEGSYIKSFEIAGPGFINLFLKNSKILHQIPESWIRSDLLHLKKTKNNTKYILQ